MGFSSTWSTWALPLLLLGNLAPVEAQTAADYYVDSLPGMPEGPPLKMHAGHIEVDPEHNGNLFFWHYQNRHIANRQRTVIWLNGGPGCSSMDGALMEVGPYRLVDEKTLEYNEGSWDEFANLLFVDQPVGTGFSYVNTDSYLHELDQVGEHFIVFLDNFFELFPQYEDDDLYFAGESYAGQYIPYIAQAIQNRNNADVIAHNKRPWNLKGLLIGNGWISPVEQYQAYLSYAYKSGVVDNGSDISDKLEAQQTLCLSALNKPGGEDQIHVHECEKILQEILRLTKTSDNQCYNMYDIRLKDVSPSCGMNWPEDLVNVEPYLRSPEVIRALNVDTDKKTGWSECSGAVGGSFNTPNSLPSIHLLPQLLESGLPIVLFSGDQDLICNHIGTEEMIHGMNWSGATGFELEPGVWAPRHDWTFEGESAGLYQEARNLTYVLFHNASHMVPFDYPRRSRDMLDRFLNVDIASIGGSPADSRIDGEKVPQTSVGGHPNSTAAEQTEKEKLKDAEWKAYSRSGEAALVVVVIAGCLWGFFVWRDRRRRQSNGYQGIYQNGSAPSGSDALERFRTKRSENADIEAGDFDESELDNLHADGVSRLDDREREHYAIGESSDSEMDDAREYRDDDGEKPRK